MMCGHKLTYRSSKKLNFILVRSLVTCWYYESSIMGQLDLNYWVFGNQVGNRHLTFKPFPPQFS